MDIDLRLARELQQGRGAPALRVYRWQPYAISLGHHQNVEDIDREKCALEGIDVVRRPTGGRAILHAEELTYSVVMEPGSRSIMEAYQLIGAALLRGLRTFDPEIGMEEKLPNFPELYKQPSSMLCFNSTSKYEIQYRGKKLVGSAQLRLMPENGGEREVVLQHGSILLGPAHRRLPDFLKKRFVETARWAVSSSDQIKAIDRSLIDRTTDLSEITGREVSFDEIAVAIRRGFEMEWNLKFETEPTPLAIDRC